jgi:sugar phosphate isomerase/epimerase
VGVGELWAGVMDNVIQAGGDEQVFARAERLGLAGVEIILARSELATRARLELLGRAQAKTGLAVPGLVLGEHSDLGGIADTDPAVAGHARDDVRRAVEWAAELGCRVILVPFFGRAELRDDADLDRAAAALAPLCALAGELGVTLCYEGTLPAERIAALAERVESDAFGCYFDLANPVVRGLDSPTEMRALGSLVRQVHVKDTRVKVGDCPPGMGRVDFAECQRALADIGYAGWLVLETPPGPPELVGRDLSFARAAFPALAGAQAWPRLGIFTYEFGSGDWDRLIETCRLFGLGAIQLGHPLLEECLDNPDQIEPIVERLDGEGISIAALAGYRNLVAPDPEKRRENLDFLARCLELAPRFGTSIVATESGTKHPESDWQDAPENTTPEAWRELEESIAELLPVAERAGSIIALEAHVKNVLKTHGQVLGLLERFPSPHLQLVLDPYNYLSHHLLPAQERVSHDFFVRFEHRFVLAHAKDVDPGGADVGTIEFGTGVFRQRSYLEFLAARRPDLPLILEHLPLEHVPEVIRQVHELAP